MIGFVRGRLLDVTTTGDSHPEVMVDVGGVGYRLDISARTASRLPKPGEEVELFVHTRVREDDITLYGFPTREERVCFEALIGAHGVGPAVALAILSVHEPSALRRVLATDDIDALTMVPGIGKKTAARLLIDLKSKLAVPDLEVISLDGASRGGSRAEVRAALAGLGYGADEVRETLQELPPEGSAEELLRVALKQLAVR